MASWFAALIVLFIVGVFVWAYFVKNANNRLEECGESGRQEEDISAEAYVEDSPVEKVYSLKTIRNIKFGSKPIVPLQDGRESCRLPIKGYYGYKWVGLDYTSAKRLATISLGDDEPNLSKAESDKRLMALIRDCDATWPGIRWNIEPQVVPPCKLFADGKLRDERTGKVIMYFHLMPGDRREGISAFISDGRIAREDGETPFWEPYVK